MISYKPFFDTLLRKNMTEYELIFKHGVSANTIHRMKKGKQSLQRHSMCSATSSIVLFLTLLNMIRQSKIDRSSNAPADFFVLGKSFENYIFIYRNDICTNLIKCKCHSECIRQYRRSVP